jgi:hypothetical protein
MNRRQPAAFSKVSVKSQTVISREVRASFNTRYMSWLSGQSARCASQAIAAAAHFLEFDGMLVPSARFACSNLVLFTDRVSQIGHLQLVSSEDVDWADWRKKNRRA